MRLQSPALRTTHSSKWNVYSQLEKEKYSKTDQSVSEFSSIEPKLAEAVSTGLS